MFASTRIMHARLSRVGDAMRILKRASAILNEKAGTNYNVAVNLGNEPGMVILTGTYEHFNTLEKVREVMWSDPELHAMLRFGEDVFLHGHENEFDRIEKIHVPAGDRKKWVTRKVMRSLPGMRQEAVPTGIELANSMAKLLGHPIGFMGAVTGNLNEYSWVSNRESMDLLENDGNLMSDSSEFHKLMKESFKVFDASTQTRSVWERVS